MANKNSNTLGLAAAVAVLICVFVLLRRRLRWGWLLFSVVIAAGEKWRENRELTRINSFARELDL